MRPKPGTIKEARERCFQALALKRLPTVEDIRTLLDATEPVRPREIDEIVTRRDLSQYDAERMAIELLGKA